MKLKRTAVAATIAAAALAAIAPAAYAASVLEVDGLTSPAGNVAFAAPLASGTTADFLSDYGVPARCATSSAAGYVERGVTVASGGQMGAITSLSMSCTLTSLKYPFHLSKVAAPTEWGIFATATPSPGAAIVPVEIRSISMYWTSTGAPPYALELGAVGTMTGTFNQNTQVLSIAPATSATYPLIISAYNGAGTKTLQPTGTGTLAGQIYTGDKLQLTGSFQLATPGIGGIHLQ